MKKSVLISISGILIYGLIMGSFGCAQAPTPASTPTPAPVKVVEWNLQSDHPLTSMYGRRGAKEMAAWLEGLTQGRLKIKVWDQDAFVPTAQTFDAVRKGVIDAVSAYGESHMQAVPEVAIINLPLLLQSAWEAWDLEYQRGAYKIYDKVYAKHGLKPFFYATNQYYSYGLNFVPKSIDDMKGKKISTFGTYLTLTQRLGGSGVAIPAGDRYMAMQTGVIDGYIQGIAGAKSAGLLKISKSYLFPTLSPVASCVWLINLDSWNRLPDDLKALIERNWPLRGLEIAAQNTAEEAHEVGILESQYGCKPVYLSEADLNKMRGLSKTLWEESAAKSPEAKQLMDIALQQLKDYGKL